MYEYKVEGMTCGHCIKRVTQSIQSLDRDAKVQVDLEKQKVQVESKRPIGEIQAKIQDAGYDVLEGHAVG